MKKSELTKIICLLIIIAVSFIGAIIATAFIDSPNSKSNQLIIVSTTETAVYSGEPLVSTGWQLASGKIGADEHLDVNVLGSQTNVGSSSNIMTAKVLNKNNEDVSENYEIILCPGVLTVKPMEITVTSKGAEKVYDGEPLTNPDYTISPELNASKFRADISIIGSRTEVGISPNTIAHFRIFDAKNNNVTDNFKITLIEGDLIVTKDGDDIIDGPGDVDGPGDIGDNPGVGSGGLLDTSGSLLGGGSPSLGEPTVFFTIVGQERDTVYLRMKSFGCFDGRNSWQEATQYSYFTDDMYSAYYITALALENSGLSTTMLSINPVGGYFALPYYALNGEFNTQYSDIELSGDTSSIYYANYYNWDSTAGIVLPTKYRDFEAAYRNHVYDNYLDIDEPTRKYMEGIIKEQGFNKNSSDVINKVAKYIQNSAKYNLKYDPALDEADNVVTAFLSEYKEGVCRHYASAATLLFRALGIPARYTIGFAKSISPNVSADVTSNEYHAWVEVYVNGIGWINVEVTGSSSDTPKETVSLEIKPEYTGAIYSSKYTESNPLTPIASVSGFNTLISKGYTYEVSIAGSIFEPGKADSEIVGFRIFDANGKLVYDKEKGIGEDLFKITYKPGILQLYYSELTFSSCGYEKIYDGLPLEITPNDCSLISGNLVNKDKYSVQNCASVTKAGNHYAAFEVAILDVYETDVTDCYKINYKYGDLVIGAREITVKAEDAEKIYDKTPLTANGIIYDPSEMSEGDYIAEYTISGSQTNIGKSSNIIKSITIRNQNGEDVTANYIIKTKEGILSVTLP